MIFDSRSVVTNKYIMQNNAKSTNEWHRKQEGVRAEVGFAVELDIGAKSKQVSSSLFRWISGGIT